MPFKQGGSVPALVEADDLGFYVVKLRGAGQGHKALVAELIAGELGRAAGLLVPELALVELDAARAHGTIPGTVPTVGDAENISKAMKDANKCFKDVKIARTSQFTDSKQKYVLELDLKCEEKKKPTADTAGSAAPVTSAKSDKPEGAR